MSISIVILALKLYSNCNRTLLLAIPLGVVSRYYFRTYILI